MYLPLIIKNKEFIVFIVFHMIITIALCFILDILTDFFKYYIGNTINTLL